MDHCGSTKKPQTVCQLQLSHLVQRDNRLVVEHVPWSLLLQLSVVSLALNRGQNWLDCRGKDCHTWLLAWTEMTTPLASPQSNWFSEGVVHTIDSIATFSVALLCTAYTSLPVAVDHTDNFPSRLATAKYEPLVLNASDVIFPLCLPSSRWCWEYSRGISRITGESKCLKLLAKRNKDTDRASSSCLCKVLACLKILMSPNHSEAPPCGGSNLAWPTVKPYSYSTSPLEP